MRKGIIDTMEIKEEKNCRVCDGFLDIVLDFGQIYPSAFLRDDEQPGEKVPLRLAECRKCGLVQLKDTINLDLMYRQYWYASSLNKSMVSSLQDIITDLGRRMVLEPGDVVLDIGCNDCTMLGMYPKHVRTIGFDPAMNLSHSTSSEVITDYFNSQAYLNIPQIKPAKIVTAIAMFYDLPDPIQFVCDVKKILHEKGIFVVQFTDLMSMFKVNAFDNICHEHLEYYRLSDLYNIFAQCGMDIIDVSYNEVNGGSVRVTTCHEGAYLRSERVVSSLVDEANYLSNHTIKEFKKKIETTKFKVSEFLKWAKGHDHQVYLLGASTKGNTLLQVCEVTEEYVPFAAEVNKEKFGLRTVGTNIKIISEEEALIKHPDYFIVPVWHFKNPILNNSRIQDYLRANGRLVFPLPEFEVVVFSYEGMRGFRI